MMVIENIKRIRSLKGISHEAMAINLGVSQGAYTKIENKETKLTVERLYAIAEVLNTDVAELLGLEIKKIYRQEFKDHATNYQEIQHLYQKNEEAYQEIIKAKDEQIALLKEMLERVLK